MNAKTRILALGVLSGALSALAALPVENPLVHFDASDASTLTVDDDGYVTEWRTPEGLKWGKTDIVATAPIETPFPTAQPLTFACPFYVDKSAADDGRAAVVFGRDKSGDKVRSLMDITSMTNLVTVFVVSRQYDYTPSGNQALYGDQSKLGCAFARISNQDCKWGCSSATLAYRSFWVNGNPGSSFADYGGTNEPHVVAATVETIGSKDWAKYLGGAYMVNGSGVERSDTFFCGDLHELVCYNRVLTDDEIQETLHYLIEKWAIGGLYLWTGATDLRWENGANWKCGFPLGADAKTIRLVGRTVTADGAIELPKTALVDLAGGSLTAAGLTGGAVTNSAQADATLTIDATVDAELDATVLGNVNLIKNGAGVLRVASGQAYTGTTTLNGGTLQALQPPFDWSKYDKMEFRLDASAAGTVVTETGTSNVTKWVSLTDNGYSFRPLREAFPNDYDFAKGEALLSEDDDGRPCVRFGAQLDDETSLGTALCPFEDESYKSLSICTVFFVNRQHVTTITSGQCGLFGQVSGPTDRMMRANGDCVFEGKNVYTVWVSGKKQYDLGASPQLTEAIEFESSSGTTGPHVLAAIRCNNDGTLVTFRTLNVIGAAYLGKTSPIAKNLCGQFDLYEAIGFSRELTEEEIREITDHLISKWGVKTREDVVVDRSANTLSPNTSYVVTAPATLDFGRMDQTFGNLSFVTESTNYPLLSFANEWSPVDLAGKTLTLSHAANVFVRRSAILESTSGIVGEFATVAGGRVWYDGDAASGRSVSAGDQPGLLLLVR